MRWGDPFHTSVVFLCTSLRYTEQLTKQKSEMCRFPRQDNFCMNNVMIVSSEINLVNAKDCYDHRGQFVGKRIWL